MNLLRAAGISAVLALVVVGIVKLSPHPHPAPANTMPVASIWACRAELMNLQAGLYGYMLANNLTTVPAVTIYAPTRDMTSPIPLFPDFVPNKTATWFFSWDEKGRVTGIGMQDGHGVVNEAQEWIPAGCFISINGR